MMAEYIDRELLVGYLNDDIAACENQPLESESVSYGCKIGLTYAVGLAKAMPDADVVEVLHGEWVDYHSDIKCSVCGAVYADEIRFMNKNYKNELLRYCPNCGAKMDGKGEGE